MRAFTYHDVYHAAYRVGAQNVDAWARKCVARLRTHRARLHWTQHALTLARSQELGRHVTCATWTAIARVHRLAQLGAVMRLRLLQRRVVRHLWRPGGALMMRQWEELLAHSARLCQ